MNQALTTTVTVAALALAAWALVGVARNRPPDLIQGIGLAVVESLVLILTAVAVLAWAGGRAPREAATGAGYLLMLVAAAPAAYALARLESSRWGSAIVAAAGLLVPVLVLRLDQVWT